MSHSDLIILPRQRDHGRVTLAAELRSGSYVQRRWYRVPAEREHALTDAADPFVLGLMYPIMSRGEPVRVRGRVSPSLLANLEEYTAAWRAWWPDAVPDLRITADDLAEPPTPDIDQTIMSFSGGVDACYTAWRHTHRRVGQRRRNLTAAILLHGFDIPLDDEAMGAEAEQRNRRLLDDLGVELIRVESNRGRSRFDTLMATDLAGALMLFAGTYRDALVAASDTYADPQYGEPVALISDRLLTSEGFAIRIDGADTLRADKCAAIAEWPAAMRDLRVCLRGASGRLNCGTCEKCLRTWMCFLAVGVDPPPIFTRTPSTRDIGAVRFHRIVPMLEWQSLLEVAERHGYGDRPWAAAARRVVGAARRQFRRWLIRAELRAWAARRGWCAPSPRTVSRMMRARFR